MVLAEGESGGEGGRSMPHAKHLFVCLHAGPGFCRPDGRSPPHQPAPIQPAARTPAARHCHPRLHQPRVADLLQPAPHQPRTAANYTHASLVYSTLCALKKCLVNFFICMVLKVRLCRYFYQPKKIGHVPVSNSTRIFHHLTVDKNCSNDPT